jgi:hypothetical protein
MEVQVRMEHDLLAVEVEHEVHVMVALTAPPAPVDADRPPVRVALVLDRSGSMGGGKPETVKRCAGFLTERLQPPTRPRRRLRRPGRPRRAARVGCPADPADPAELKMLHLAPTVRGNLIGCMERP